MKMKKVSLILSTVVMTAMVLIPCVTVAQDEVTIGKQVWMVENLNVDKFRNGDPIPQAKTDEEWKKSGENKQPAWCYHENDPVNGEKYGKLYNWYAVNDSRGLVPDGYHIPSDAEWTELEDFLGGESVAGTKMKSTDFWADYLGESGNGTNEIGFSGLPAGFRTYFGSFSSIGYSGRWWSSTEGGKYGPWTRVLGYGSGEVYRKSQLKGEGFSVRCLRD